MRRLLALAVVLPATGLVGGCATITAMFLAVKKALFVFVLAGLGAFLGLATGPIGAVVGAGAGAVIGSALDENADLRAGHLQGSGARDREEERELERLKNEVTILNIEKNQKVFELLTAEGRTNWLWSIIKWVVGLFAVLIFPGIGWHWRNRHNWAQYGYRRGVWKHGLFGGEIGREPRSRRRERDEVSKRLEGSS